MRSIIHPTRRSAAAFAAFVLAVTGVGLAAPAAGSPLAASTAVEEPATDRTPNWAPELGSTATADVFENANGRLDMGTPEVAPAANPTVSGTLLYRAEPDGPTAAVTTGNGVIRFWRESSPNLFAFEGQIETFSGGGEFFIDTLPGGDYIVEFISFNAPAPSRIYWNGEPVFAIADKLALNDDVPTALGTVVIEPRTLDFYRISGPSRFDTAAAIAESAWPDGSGPIPVVYIINGLGYADALSAGPAAASQGGILLPVLLNSIPAVIQDQLERLQPERIVVVGSSLAISNSVETALEEFVADPADVERIAGSSRYATSRAIVADAFGDEGLTNVFVSTGRNFPDALAAGPAASRLEGAVLLVDGLSPSGIDIDTRQLLIDLGRPDIFITGSDRVVTSTVAEALESTLSEGGVVLRLAGTSRFDTARVINDFAFGATETYPDFAFIANGLGFADALTGGPLAARFNAPMYLSLPQCLSQDVFGDLLDLIVVEAYALGSPLALSDRVLYGDFC